MKITLLVLLIVLSSSCEEEISFGYSVCTFYVHYYTSSCVDFSFIMCSWEECTSSYIDNNGTEHCNGWTTFNDTSWPSCTNRCCDGDVDYPQTYSSITQCQDYLNNHFKLIMAIIFSVLGGILLIVCIVCLRCGKCCDCAYKCLERIRDVFCCRCLRNRTAEEEPKSTPYDIETALDRSRGFIEKKKQTSDGCQETPF